VVAREFFAGLDSGCVKIKQTTLKTRSNSGFFYFSDQQKLKIRELSKFNVVNKNDKKHHN
jgi:hypothetical protein